MNETPCYRIEHYFESQMNIDEKAQRERHRMVLRAFRDSSAGYGNFDLILLSHYI